jgi:alkylhydroperoxidase/carboxymuconolactone decarboxylase family protein YurZ
MKKKKPSAKLPSRFLKFQKDYPDIFDLYEQLGAATRSAGPLDAKTHALVKLGIAAGASMEGAVHSHVRRAREVGCSDGEIRQVALVALTTLGFPRMMTILSWIDETL